MEYITRNLTSDPGMDQREALTALQTDPTFVPGSIVASIRRHKASWVAEVLEPKTAEFPPSKDEAPDSEGGDETAPKEDAGPPAPSDDGGEEGPPSDDGAPKPPGEGGDKKPEGGKGNTEDAILHTLTQILHALQGGGAPEGMGGPDALGPPDGGIGGPPPPKGGPPMGAGGPPPGKGGPPGGAMKGLPPMKPGMTPPGGTPIGAPAFASTRQANPIMPAQGTPVPNGVEPGPIGQQAQAGVCPQDGNPEPCPVHGAQAPGMPQNGLGGLNQAVAAYSGKAATITLTTEGTDLKQAVADAKPVVENYGYQVKQAKHGVNGQIHILASRR